MRLQRQSNGQYITLDSDSVLGVGGEARIYAVPQDPWLVAKVYHRPTAQRARKLTVMLADPPEDPMAAQGRVSIAWPVELLRSADSKAQIVGFLMPLVTGMRPIFDFYNPGARRKYCPLFNYMYLHRAARNLAAAVSALHDRGYVIGDVNESNIFVAETALVALVDTDSFQVRDSHNHDIYRCTVGKIEFTPPEIQGKNFSDINRKPAHDLFGLAVLIFQLLMEGTHPFTGVYKGAGDPPSYADRISAGHFPFSGKRRVPYLPSLVAPPFEILHPHLRELFLQCFRSGRRRARLRPNAQTWQNALNEAEKTLITCSENVQHLYGSHLKTCPWCKRSMQLGGRDPFPSQQSVENGQHLQPVSRTRAPVSAAAPTASISQETADIQPSSVEYHVWSWTSLMLASLAMLMLGDVLLPMHWWPSLVCGMVTTVWCTFVWLRVRKSSGRNKWMATAALGLATALILSLLLVTVLTDESLPWWSILVCESVLGPAALVFGAINWQKGKALAGYRRWMAGAALGTGIMASISAISLVALLVYRDSLPRWLSLVFAPSLGPVALICGMAGWQRVRRLAGHGKWLKGLALGTGTAITVLSLLALLEAFMIAGGRLYLTALVCEAILIPVALAYGTIDWQRVKSLKGNRKWLTGAALAVGTAIVLLLLLIVAVLLGEGLPWWLSLVCAGILSLALSVSGVIGWRRVRTLTGHKKRAAAAALGILAVLMVLLLAAALARESLPSWLSLVGALLLGPMAFICGAAGWRQARMLAGRRRWMASAALGLGTMIILLSLLALLGIFMISSGRLYLAALLCEAELGPIALIYGTIGWQPLKTLAKHGKWKVGAVLGVGSAMILALLLGIALLIGERL